jgi:hypothetical protein
MYLDWASEVFNESSIIGNRKPFKETLGIFIFFIFRKRKISSNTEAILAYKQNKL